MNRIRSALSTGLVVGAVLAAACSPEAGRTRSGGPGADTGNRGGSVELHGGQRADGMFYKTPRVGQGAQTQR